MSKIEIVVRGKKMIVDERVGKHLIKVGRASLAPREAVYETRVMTPVVATVVTPAVAPVVTPEPIKYANTLSIRTPVDDEEDEDELDEDEDSDEDTAETTTPRKRGRPKKIKDDAQ